MKRVLFLLVLSLLYFSCGKENPAATNAPANLTISAVVSTDSSGNVLFTSTADNADSFEYNFGTGDRQTSSSGIVTYKYAFSGTYTVIVVAKNATGQTLSKSIKVTISVPLALLWSDEFDTDGAPNSAKWGYDLGGGGWGNNELEYYTNRPDNATVSNGTLKIIAKRENFNGSAFTSARLITKDKFAFTYGKVEISAKLPAGAGTWAAAWMLGANINTVAWPGCGEIDIMEHRGSELNRIFGTLHYPGRSGGNANGNTLTIADATTQFHQYSLDWNATSIQIFVDDQLIHSVGNSSSIPFNHDFFFILNVAVGGSFAGSVDPEFTSGVMEVDYIRVYK